MGVVCLYGQNYARSRKLELLLSPIILRKLVYKVPRNNSQQMRKQRRDSAIIRGSLHSLVMPEQQVEALDKRLGKGVGAKRERAALKKRIS